MTKVGAKVKEAKKRALEGSYSKPRASYGQMMGEIQSDPTTSMGVGKFQHF